MNPAAWRKVDELFHTALALPPTERDRYLEDACAGDTALRGHVMALLARAEESGDLLPVDIGGAFAALSGSDLQPGDTVGVYRIEGPAGTGGVGRIYAAQDTRLGRKVALKFLASHHIWNQEMVLRFRREARLTSNLNHPNIVTVHDVGQMGSSTYIVTEFIEGETLRTRMLRAPLPAGEVFHLMRQIVSALAAAHSRGIVHRDIKPENIMIRPDGVVKVLDFGLARPHEDATTDTAALETVSGSVLGTLPYMSPEQVRGRTVDVRTDLWSLGVLLFELFEQKRPFTGDTANHLAVSILESPVPPMKRAPREMEPLIRRLLEKDRAGRPSSAAKLAPWFEGLPMRAKSSRADVFKWGGAVIAAIALLTAAVLAWRRLPSARDLPDPPRQITDSADVTRAAVSPDGQYLAYVRGREGAQSLWVRKIDTLADHRLTEDSTDRYLGLTFSNDSNYVYCVIYSAGSRSDLVRVSIWDGQRFKAHSNIDSSIAFAPDGDRFAFVRMMPGVRSLIVARLSDQSEQEILTKKPPAAFSSAGPAWSPDGRLIVVATQDPDTNSPVALTRVDVATRRAETLASGFSFVGRPVWLARGVVAGASRKGEPSQLLLISPPRPEGVALTNDLSAYAVTTTTLRGDILASVRYATRSWISFTNPQTDTPGVERLHALTGQPRAERFRGVRWLDRDRLVVPVSSGPYTNLWAIRRPPGQRQPLTSGEHVSADGAPCGPGGVVFVQRRPGEASIRFLDLKTNIVRPVVDKLVNPALPQCTPDGRTVVYLASQDGVISLWSVDRDGGTPRRLTEHVTRNAALSPDGSQIVTQFSEAGTGGKWRVALLPRGGGAPVRWFSGVPSASVLRWHPSGKAFTYLSTRQSTAEFWNQPADGTPAVRVAALAEPGRVTDFDWSPDGILSYLTAITDQDAVIFRLP